MHAVCEGNLDVVFMLDASGSIEEKNFAKIIAFVSAIVDRMSVDNGRSRVGAITFSDHPAEQFALGSHSTSAGVRASLATVHYTRGTTDLAAAIELVRTRLFGASGDRAEARNVAVVITDGESNNRTLTLEAARRAKEEGVVLVTVGVGSNIDWFELQAIASFPPHRNMFLVTGFSTLDTLIERIGSVACTG